MTAPATVPPLMMTVLCVAPRPPLPPKTVPTVPSVMVTVLPVALPDSEYPP